MIPKETNKELYVTIENEDIHVASTPSILDAIIVAGKAPELPANTVLYSDYDSTTFVLTLRTFDGRVFTINNVEETP